MTVAGLVLAAGKASRFGSPKVLARLDGRHLLEHVLATARAAGLAPIVVVLGDDAEAVEAAIAWQDERRVRNPRPELGLSSSLRIGLDAIRALEPPVEACVLLLGDQPLTRRDVIERLLVMSADASSPIVQPRYEGGGGPHPVLIRRAAFGLAAETSGDRGLGPLVARRPDLVLEVPVPGINPDVDTPADLAALVEAAWERRVIANREQVDRFRERPDDADFYAPVSNLFRADPARANDPILEALGAFVGSRDLVLDIGCGAGRFALPLARRVQAVVGVDPSAGMLAALREGMAEHGIANVRIVEGRWPEVGEDVADALRAEGSADGRADVAVIVHVGYDHPAIGPFLAAMEGAARRQCIAVVAEPAPASLANPFWPRVHGEERIALPGAGLLLELLNARGRSPAVRWLDWPPRGYAGRDDLVRFLRHQTWVEPGSAKDLRLSAAIDELTVVRDGQWYVREPRPGRMAVISWTPPEGMAAAPSPTVSVRRAMGSSPTASERR